MNYLGNIVSDLTSLFDAFIITSFIQHLTYVYVCVLYDHAYQEIGSQQF